MRYAHSDLALLYLHAAPNLFSSKAEALVRLAGDGDENATAKVMSVLEEIERIRLLSRANAAISPKKEVVKRPLPAPYPGIKPMLEMRPRPKEELGGTGIRKVPRFIQAGGFPMLRFSKRHSPFLSRVIKQKVLREDSIHKRLEAQESMMKMGEDEDLWDDLVKRQWRNEISRDSGMEGSSWKNEMQTQMKRDRAIINEENRKTRATAKKMLDVVRKEEELAARERMDRKRGRKGEKDRKRWRENLGLKGR